MIEQDRSERIYVMGFMGSGKSTLGRQLAGRLDRLFFDLDDLIVERAGKPISLVFAEEGEAWFRKLETETLIATGELHGAFIALGGGTPCFGSNMDWIHAHGISAYLDVPEGTLYGRLKDLRPGRPLLEALDDEELRQFVKETMAIRRPYYARADVLLDPDMTVPKMTAILQDAIHRG